MAPVDKKTKKVRYFKHMNELLSEHSKILLVNCDNVRSNQLMHIRMALRGHATILCGKNTMMKKVLSERYKESQEERDRILYEKLAVEKLLAGNVGMIFTNKDLTDIRKIIEEHRVQAPARSGTLAPIDVTVPAGNTGLEPTKTQFFQALGINTKITKGTVEILKDEKVIFEGTKVGSSEAALLQMLGIKPFWYGLIIENVYDNGSVYGAHILDLTDDDMAKKVTAGISNVAALSLGLGIPTQASMPHIFINGFKDILGISVGTDYDFDEFNGAKLKDAILNGPAPGDVAAAAAPAAAAEAAPAAAQEEDESDEEMGMGLFD